MRRTRLLRPAPSAEPTVSVHGAGGPERTAEREGNAGRGLPGRAVEDGRLVRLFPPLLGGAVVVVVATVAGGPAARSLLLGASMLLLQLAVGALSGPVLSPRVSAGGREAPVRQPAAGIFAARVAPAASAVAGLLLALAAGPPVVLLAAIALAIGAWHALVADGTRLSWVAPALWAPLLPVYGWLGVTSGLPSAFAVLVPGAALGAAGLAIASSTVDLERDAAAARRSLARALGPVRAAELVFAIEVAVAALAVTSAWRLGAAGAWQTIAAAAAVVPVAGALMGLAAAGRGPGAREVSFELQAVGLGLLVVAWVNAVSLAPA